jgi:hypothetical protein
VDIFEENRLIYRRKEIGPLIVAPNQSASRWEDYNLFDVACRWEFDN